MRRASFIVEQDNRDRRTCPHCPSEVGTEHAPGCPHREKTVVIRAHIEYVVRVPEHWGQDEVEFRYNDSSWCASNALDDLTALRRRREEQDSGSCGCGQMTFDFVREATEEDEANDLNFINESDPALEEEEWDHDEEEEGEAPSNQLLVNRGPFSLTPGDSLSLSLPPGESIWTLLQDDESV